MHKLTLVSFAALALVACAAPPNPGLRLRYPTGTPAPASETMARGIPADIDWAETSFTGAGGIALYAQRFRPATGTSKAVIAIHHGLADHSTRYTDVAVRLVHAGYTVWAFDMRGHGRSAGSRVMIDQADDFLDDLDAFLSLVRVQEPSHPIFLYGHSIGGLITCLYTIERQPALAGLVLAAPGIAIDAPPLLPGAISVLAALTPNLPLFATPHRDFSRRDDVVAEMDHDPLIAQPAAPARTARTAIDAIARVWAAPERLRVPLLVVHGRADKLTAPMGSREIVTRAGSTDKMLRIYDGLVHDLLREPDGGGEQVQTDVIAWLNAHTGGPAVTFPSSEPSTPLRGDRHGQLLSVALDTRGEVPRTGATGVTAGLRIRFGVGRSDTLGLGYVGGIDVRGGVLDGSGVYEADLHPIGIAVRARSGMMFALTGGVGLGGIRGPGASHAPIELSAELPAGQVHMFARGSLGWRLGGDRYASEIRGVADELTATLGLRLGRDRHYWPNLVGGGGPYLAATYRNLGGVELFGLALGVDLFGGN